VRESRRKLPPEMRAGVDVAVDIGKTPFTTKATNDIEVYRQANVFASCGREQST